MAFVPVPPVPVPVAAPSLGVRFPGGIQMSAQLPTTSPSSNLENAAMLLGRVTAGLGPLGAVFSVIEAVLAIKDFADAVPKLLTEPTAVVEAIVELGKKVSKLVSLIPQLSFPIMLFDMVEAMVTLLEGLQVELAALVAQQDQIALAEAELPNAPGLGPVIDQATADVATQSDNLGSILVDVDAIIGIINIFAQVLGIQVPASGSLPNDPGEAIDALDPLIKILRDLLNAIPV